MPVFYRGAGIGTHWHNIDARIDGFTAQSPQLCHSVDLMMAHIINGTTDSPYISLTSSYGIADDYAQKFSVSTPTRETPAFVYRLEIPEQLNSNLRLFDPIHEIVTMQRRGSDIPVYHHDGKSSFLLGVIDPQDNAQQLQRPVSQPPPHGGTPRPANLSYHLETIVRALRDAEILAFGTIPNTWVTARYNIY